MGNDELVQNSSSRTYNSLIVTILLYKYGNNMASRSSFSTDLHPTPPRRAR